jgi:hypothetical protein
MKSKRIILLGTTGTISVLLACLLLAHGGSAVRSTPFLALSSVSVPEIPATAADLVHVAAASDREQTAEEVLHAVSVIARPGVLPYVVSAICRSDPEVAGSVVTTAIELQPDDVLDFSEAALCAAPGQAEQIVFSACKTAPHSCANVALAAYTQLPSSQDLILAGLVGALPYLQDYVEAAEVEVGTNDFAAVMNQTVQLYNNDLKAQAK